MCLKITNNAIVVFNERKEKEMKTQEVIERLEKGLGIKFSEVKGGNCWNNKNTSIRVIDNSILKYAYADINGIIDTTYWINHLEQATDKTVDEFVSKIKLHLPKVRYIKKENIYTMLDEIKDYQKKINILLNKIEKEMK